MRPLTQGHKKSTSQLERREREMAMEKVSQLISSNAVQVFTKPYCGFCRRVRQLLKELRAEFKTYDLEWEPDGREMQKALAELTGRSTVPNVFIGGKNVGGCNEIISLHEAGKLVPMLTEAGALPEVVAGALPEVVAEA